MAAPFRILKFWTKYAKRAGETVGIDMVEYCAVGMATRSTTVAPVSMLSKIREDVDADNQAYAMAKGRWEVIGPAYAAWKAGNELPTNGTPLAAWAGITAEQADIIKQTGLRTVEDIANATDSVIQRVQLPGIRDIHAQAKLFLSGIDKSQLAADLADKDRRLAEMAEQLEEMRQIVLAQSNPDLQPDGSEAPRKRGRPPNPRNQDEVAA
jgi:hypothetical protein